MHFTIIKKIRAAGVLLLLLTGILYPQSENHKWKPVDLQSKQKLFVDINTSFTSSDTVLSFWVLELHRPAVEMEGVTGKITRTKTLYIYYTGTKKYGIRKIVYYNASSEEMKRYNYDKNLSSLLLLCTFPVFQNSPVEAALKILNP